MTEEIHKTYTLCQELIWLTPSSSTYCMRERGHPDEGVKGFPGGHNIVNEVPKDAKSKSDDNPTG
jgi:hypothetical protein